MDIERVLRAAVNSMINGHHAPHCFSSHIPGQGYIGKGDGIGQTRAEYLRQLERSAQSEVENMGYAPHYCANQGETDQTKGVLMANWNTLPNELTNILERMGYAIEWSDEWTTCESCNGALRTQPDGYCWTPAYKLVDDCTILCLDCYADEHGTDEDEDNDTEGEQA